MTTQQTLTNEMVSFFEKTLDLVCIAGKDGYFRNVNPAVIYKLGYTKEELLASPIDTFIHPEDKGLTASERKKLFTGNNLLNFQNRYVAKNGDIVWLEWTSNYFADTEVVFAIAKDVTSRKNIEKEIEKKYKKFKGLATHFKSRIEKDRKYLAIELHEELAQLASVVKMDLDWVNFNETDISPVAKSRVEHAMAISDLLINTIRRISFSLSPSMLEDLGLNEALKWHCKEFAILNGIPCTFKSDFNEADLSQEVTMDFFRICQEALTNAMYHAHAKSVEITIEDTGTQICISIIDNGEGFDTSQPMKNDGFVGIKERIESINGQLSISSTIGKGTIVKVTVGK